MKCQRHSPVFQIMWVKESRPDQEFHVQQSPQGTFTLQYWYNIDDKKENKKETEIMHSK